ncbi:MAG TPA: SurA N-terminal domain-containing protein [Blastocatellia bacterium]|nr:SurA N-terminal domain-containing protein [Blastocatellia bacterium]
MKAKRQFSTGKPSPVKPFRPINDSLPQAGESNAFKNQRQTGVCRTSSLRSIAVFRSIKIISIVLCASALLVACKSESDTSTLEVAAKVGSHEIKLKQVDSTIKQQLDANGGNATMSPAELVAARLSVLDNLIQEEAMFQKAQKENLVPDDSKVNQEVQKRKQDAGLTEEQYQNQIKQAGFTEEEVRDQIRRQLAINELRERQKSRVSAPTDGDIEKYFADHKSEFKAERGADISVIAISPVNNGGEAGAEQKIRGVYAQLKSGSDFATVASQKSEEQASAMRGGRLGFASEAGMRQSFAGIPDITTRIMPLTEGQYTEPIKDNTGNWYIFKLNLKREAPQNLTLNDVRTDIINTITQQRQQVLLNALVLVTLSETTTKNYLAERIIQSPQTIVEMRPSQLLQQAAQQQPQPRIENENQPPATNSNRLPSNANRAASNSNTR